MLSKTKLTILATVFLDVLGIGLVLPILPLYVEHLSHSTLIAASFFSVYSLCGFLSTPWLGALSDRYGRRPVLLLSLFGTAVGWIVFALGQSLLMLTLGRIIDGITSGNITTAQSYLTDLSEDEHERTHNLGLMGATFGIGFIVGPALGSGLSQIAPSLPFLTAAVLALGNTVAAYFFLPETNRHRNPNNSLSFNPLRGLKKAFGNPKLRPLFISWTLFALAFNMMQSVFALFTVHAYGLTEAQNGIIFSCIGVIVALNQGVLLKRFWLKKFKLYTLEIISALLIMFAYAFISILNFKMLIIGLALLPFGQALFRVVNMSGMTAVADIRERGEVIGVANSLMFLAAIIAPIAGGWLLTKNLALPWQAASVCLFFGLLAILRRKKIFEEASQQINL